LKPRSRTNLSRWRRRSSSPSPSLEWASSRKHPLFFSNAISNPNSWFHLAWGEDESATNLIHLKCKPYSSLTQLSHGLLKSLCMKCMFYARKSQKFLPIHLSHLEARRSKAKAWA
jgi:hypothetical protein